MCSSEECNIVIFFCHLSACLMEEQIGKMVVVVVYRPWCAGQSCLVYLAASGLSGKLDSVSRSGKLDSVVGGIFQAFQMNCGRDTRK